MKLCRRNFLHRAAGAAAFTITTRIASVLDYPARPVRIIVGSAAGGAPDIVARLVAQQLSERLGQAVGSSPGVVFHDGVGPPKMLSVEKLVLSGSVAGRRA